MTTFIVWLIILIILSGLFSCSETSLFSLSKSDVTFLDEHSPLTGRRTKRLLATPRKTLITILIGNMFVNILSSSTCESYIHTAYPKFSILLSLAIMTPLILVFGEVAPKIIAFQLRRKTIPSLSLFVRYLYWVLYPLQYVVFKFTDPFIHLVSTVIPHQKEEKDTYKYSQEEVNAAIEIGFSKGLFDKYEKTLVTNLVNFRPTTAKYILTPRTEIFSIDINTSIEKIKDKILNSPFSRIPIVDGSEDNIIGVFLLKDIFCHENLLTDKNVFIVHLKEPHFVPETIKAHRLFSLMVRRQIHIHFVVDEYGGLEGLVTLDDVLSEVFGTIQDDNQQDTFFWPDEDEESAIIVKAGTPIDEYNTHLTPRIEDADSVTVGGFISNRLSRVPVPGDSLEYKRHRFTILSASDTRSLLIKINPLDSEEHKSGGAV